MFQDRSSLVYCNNIVGLIKSMGLRVWCYGIDFLLAHPAEVSKWFFYIMGIVFHLSLLCFQYKWNKLTTAFIYCLLLNYQEQKWLIYRDIKMVELILGLQGGYTKYPCFLCLWNCWGDNQHHVRQEWPLLRQGLKPDLHNIQSQLLIESNKILLLPLHIKLGVKKNFVKAMNREDSCSRFWKSLVEVESTNWRVVKLFNMQNKLMDVHQSDISKILPFSTSNLVSFIFSKSRHETEAYLVLLHKTSHTSCVLFFVWFPCAGMRESTPSVSSR